jgi:DNA-binding beta-propeller fold protein YncE
MRARLWIGALILTGLLLVLAPAGASATTLYVSNYLGDTISAFAVNHSGSLTQVGCEGTNCETGTYPQGVAVTPSGRFL